MKILLSLLLLSPSLYLFSQDPPTEISIQYGPETGLSLLFPKFAYRPAHEGAYLGGFVSVNMVAVAAISVGIIGGYRRGGLAGETSLAFTVVSGSSDGMKKGPAIFQANLNPKIILGHHGFVGFGPGIYLFKSKKRNDSLWDDAGKYNFELGYSENFRF